MNVAYLKVTCGLRFHLFIFYFLGAGLLLSFHGHSCPSIMIICIQPQTWSASGRGCGNGASRFLIFLSNWDGAPPRVGALSKLSTLHIGSGGTDFYRPRYRSYRTDRKGTLASDLKGAGARAPLCTPLSVSIQTMKIKCICVRTTLYIRTRMNTYHTGVMGGKRREWMLKIKNKINGIQRINKGC